MANKSRESILTQIGVVKNVLDDQNTSEEIKVLLEKTLTTLYKELEEIDESDSFGGLQQINS